jgi:hypothetical protein
MNPNEKFVRDYFELGEDTWLERYARQVPVDMNPSNFVREAERLGLEKKFIDECDWKDGGYPQGYLYLISEGPDRYAVYTVERAIPILRGQYSTLHDALLHKANLIFTFLELTALPKKPLQRD